MENNFLTDSQLPATVADLKAILAKVTPLPSIPVNLANNEFGNGSLTLRKNASNYTQIWLESLTKKMRFLYLNDELGLIGYNSDDTSPFSIMTINNSGTISKVGGGSFAAISDERMKDNIKPFEDGLNKILSINPKSFQYKAVEGTPTENYPDFICQKTQYGVIAQELETVAPEMVTTNADGYKSVDLSNLCLLLVNAVKEQNQMILELTARVEALENPTPQA